MIVFVLQSFFLDVFSNDTKFILELYHGIVCFFNYASTYPISIM